jgi:hypothetical protein
MFIGKQEPKRVKTTHPHKEMVLSEVSKKEHKVVTREKKPTVSNIKIDLGEDIDTLIDTNVTINLNIKSLPKGFFLNWHLDNNSSILTTIPSLTKSFKEGEHLIKVQLYNSNGDIVSEDNLTIKAWRYKKIEKYEYSIKKDDFLLIEGKVLNYKNKILLLFDYIHSIKYTYNKFGKILEKEFKFFKKPKNNYKIVYEYDSENNELILAEMFDESGELIDSYDFREEDDEYYEYNSQSYESGENEEEYNTTYGVEYLDDTTYSKYDDNDREIYKESYVLDYKIIVKKEYDDNDRVIVKKRIIETNNSIEQESIYNFEYNEDGEVIQKEIRFQEDGKLQKHYITKFYYKNGLLEYEETEAIVGSCSYINYVLYEDDNDINITKSKTIYSYDNNGTLISSKYLYQKKDDFSFKEKKKAFTNVSYSNSLEEDDFK